MLRDVAGNPNYVRPQQERISLEESSPVKAALDWMQVLSDMASAAPNDQQDPGIFRIRVKFFLFLTNLGRLSISTSCYVNCCDP